MAYALLRGVLKPGMVIVDVGANIGDWTRRALAFQPSLQIYAFEPVSHLFEGLQMNVQGGPVVCINAALSNQIGAADIFVDRDWVGAIPCSAGTSTGGRGRKPSA